MYTYACNRHSPKDAHTHSYWIYLPWYLYISTNTYKGVPPVLGSGFWNSFKYHYIYHVESWSKPPPWPSWSHEIWRLPRITEVVALETWGRSTVFGQWSRLPVSKKRLDMAIYSWHTYAKMTMFHSFCMFTRGCIYIYMDMSIFWIAYEAILGATELRFGFMVDMYVYIYTRWGPCLR